MLKPIALLTLCLLTVATTVYADAGMERCYGVAKAGQNDCDTAPNAGPCSKSVIDSDPNFFIYVPKGLCNRLTGGLSKNEAGAGTVLDTDFGPVSTTTTTTTTSTNMPAVPPVVAPTQTKDSSSNTPSQSLESNYIFPEPKTTP